MAEHKLRRQKVLSSIFGISKSGKITFYCLMQNGNVLPLVPSFPCPIAEVSKDWGILAQGILASGHVGGVLPPALPLPEAGASPPLMGRLALLQLS